jgi:hypothetical protein
MSSCGARAHAAMHACAGEICIPTCWTACVVPSNADLAVLAKYCLYMKTNRPIAAAAAATGAGTGMADLCAPSSASARTDLLWAMALRASAEVEAMSLELIAVGAADEADGEEDVDAQASTCPCCRAGEALSALPGASSLDPAAALLHHDTATWCGRLIAEGGEVVRPASPPAPLRSATPCEAPSREWYIGVACVCCLPAMHMRSS